jgi:hypothetical protein
MQEPEERICCSILQDRQRKNEAHSRNYSCRGKAINIKYYEGLCVRILALVIRHAKRMRHIMLPSMACEALLYFPTDFINGTTFGIKKLILQKICVFPLPVFSETFLILRRIQKGIAKMYIRLHIK